MNLVKTPFEGLVILEPRVFRDARGYFMESYNQQTLASMGIHTAFCQDNQSQSVYGVIRGLHFQRPPHAQTKLIRVLQGSILDVAVDLRQSSSTFGKHFTIALSDENKKQLLIPAGFAHGFAVLSPSATILYKCDQFYHQPSDGGIRYNDPALGIDWQIPEAARILSDKDARLPLLKEATLSFQ